MNKGGDELDEDATSSSSYRDNVGDLFRLEDYEEEVTNSLTFRQGYGLITTKTTFEGKPTDYWVLTHYKSSNIVNVALKDRWRHSEASVKIFTSDKSKDQSLNSSLNQTMQAVFDTMLQDLDRRTIKSKIIFSCVW
ncbi:uncharacterized protein LOC111028120 [Myzus persicae]|uniref:uncharacterized protein LOC111028120 n=1 Tax=Myzus persicae TaxID=13164 RepID=UPI000B935FFD|nr:uncharacterized protein LOC111028120 [Myzus persicae]